MSEVWGGCLVAFKLRFMLIAKPYGVRDSMRKRNQLRMKRNQSSAIAGCLGLQKGGDYIPPYVLRSKVELAP